MDGVHLHLGIWHVTCVGKRGSGEFDGEGGVTEDRFSATHTHRLQLLWQMTDNPVTGSQAALRMIDTPIRSGERVIHLPSPTSGDLFIMHLEPSLFLNREPYSRKLSCSDPTWPSSLGRVVHAVGCISSLWVYNCNWKCLFTNYCMDGIFAILYFLCGLGYLFNTHPPQPPSTIRQTGIYMVLTHSTQELQWVDM